VIRKMDNEQGFISGTKRENGNMLGCAIAQLLRRKVADNDDDANVVFVRAMNGNSVELPRVFPNQSCAAKILSCTVQMGGPWARSGLC
jgi:hypothetical protein